MAAVAKRHGEGGDTMATAVIEVPDEDLEKLAPYQDRLGEALLLGLSQLRIREALRQYQQGAVSFARAAEIAGMSREELAYYAGAQGIEPRWSEKMVEEELGCVSLPTPGH